MKLRTRRSGADAHARNRTIKTSLPTGALPLAIALSVLIVVPIARAAGDDNAARESRATGGAPVAVEAMHKVKIRAKVTRARALNGAAIRVSGRTVGTGRGKAHVRLAVRRSGSRAWKTVATTNVRAGKMFTVSWRGNRAGRYMSRVSVRKFGQTAIDRTGRVYVFRRSFASYYGPGLYGGALACGGRLSPGTVGVAHKTLPCGTRVTFTLGNGRVVTAPVIDRGPFVAGREWDLTSGLKNKLGFGSTGAVYTTR